MLTYSLQYFFCQNLLMSGLDIYFVKNTQPNVSTIDGPGVLFTGAQTLANGGLDCISCLEREIPFPLRFHGPGF